ncbi:hypothetical protein [Natrinema halophilum]|uniref:Uncharacterized protein n=1 Tax=Natrinema halophilum TaxID=1699371 RepID=A0A7D5GK13_9EURY|nr:hypothetical protein [Natrinema halophilum]QLG48870.1 hypothetical protein HYG82_08405 [Natrinema halophilum]
MTAEPTRSSIGVERRASEPDSSVEQRASEPDSSVERRASEPTDDRLTQVIR